MKWRKITKTDLPLLLDWRTDEKITKFMYTDIEYNLQKQEDWFEKINRDQNGLYRIIEYKQRPIGFISLTSIDWQNKSAYWNFYIGDQRYSMLAGLLGFYVYNFAFNKLGLNKLLGEVMASNIAVRKLHIRQGAREVGYFSQHILKNNSWHDVYIFEMLADEWQLTREKYSRYNAEVEL